MHQLQYCLRCKLLPFTLVLATDLNTNVDLNSALSYHTPSLNKKNSQNCFHHNFSEFPTTLKHFWQRGGQDDRIMQGGLFPPHLIYVNALLCETQMLQIVTLRADYLYQIAHLCIINSTEGATQFNKLVVLNIL